MYTHVKAIRNLFSPLSRSHGHLKALRPVSTVVPEKCDSSEDSLADSCVDQNRICNEDTAQKPHRTPEDSTSHLISVLTMQRSKSRWGHLQSLRPKGFDPEEFSEIIIAIRNNSHLALRFFRWTQNKSLCNHNTSSYSTIIHILARGRLKHQARLIICEAIRVSGSDELKPDLKPLKVFETLTKTYKRCDSAPFVFDLLIEACLDSKKFKPVIRIVRMLLSRNISPSYGTCNSLLRQVSRFVGAKEGHDLYKAIFGLKNSRVRPSVAILNTLMVAFYQESALEKVENIWDEIIQSGCEPNCFSFSILMAAYCDEGKINKAEEVWEKMKASKVEFDIVAYNTIIGGFCQAGELEKAEEYFREMGLRGIESSSTTYEHLILGYCKMGKLDSAILIYKDIDTIGFSPEAFTIDTLIRALCYGDRVLEALDVSKCAKGSVGFCPARESFEVLIAGLCREENMEEALKLQAEMVAGGFEPSREIYGAFISSYEEQGNVEMASKLKKEMLESGM